MQYAPIFQKYGYASTSWSPLCGGFLTGKYSLNNIPKETRYSGKLSENLNNFVLSNYYKNDPEKFFKTVEKLQEISKKQNWTLAQLAIAWWIVNKDN